MKDETLQALSAEVVLAESSDLEGLASIRGHLGKVIEWADQASRTDLVEIASAADRLLGEILQENVQDPDAALEFVGQAISSLQQAMSVTSAASEGDEAEGASILAEFLADQEGSLEEMEALVLALDDDTDGSQLATLKGKLHTLKGEVGALEMTDVSTLCHSLEEVIARRPLEETRGNLLEAVDWLRRRFAACGEDATPPAPFELNSETSISSVAEPTSPAAATAVERASSEPAIAEEEVDSIFLEPSALTGDPELTGDFIAEARQHLEEVDDRLLSLEKSPKDAEAINSVFRAFHTIKGLAGFLALPCVQRVSHEAETMLDMARAGTLTIEGPLLTLAFEVNDALKRLIAGIEQALVSGELMQPDAALPSLMRKLRMVIHDGSLPDSTEVAQGLGAEVTVPSAQAGLEARPPTEEGKGAAKKTIQVRETVKVDASRLDELVDSIGELVIAETMVSQCEEINLDGATNLPRLLTRMDKITRELQELAMSLRMVPVRSIFRRMARLAHDVASRVGKQIDFVTRGDDTDLDKTVVDSIGDPLVHMVRNAVDHGIEDSTEERRLAGKPPVGRIELRAFHQGGSIHIEIEDDGKGLDSEKILAKARENGIVSEADKLTESEIFGLILSPGFSTAQQVTDVSGRGVGLDVVKRGIEALRGTVEIRSTLGKGSVFSLRLPLTLAIIDGMVVRVGEERYILPTVSIVRMVCPEEENLTRVFDKRTLLKVGEELIPMFRLDQLFDIPNAAHDSQRVSAVIVEHGDRRCAFLVDQLLGQQQIVIKPLGPALAGTPGLAGGAIMPDGKVGLILDVASLVQLAQSVDTTQETAAASSCTSF